jgi:Xaa-Pro aminopeptidase
VSIDSTEIALPALTDSASRRLDVDAKQQVVSQLLHDCGCDGVLVLDPANFRWLTSGADPVGLLGHDELPALYFTSMQRWLLASSVDSQRMFAEELDGLGFMLKEWNWSASREQMLVDLVFGRNVAADVPFRECKSAGQFFVTERRKLTAHEAEQTAELGQLVAHAVEATARNLAWGDSEEEIAGHLAHRLLRHGAIPVALQVTGDGRGEFRRRSFGSRAVDQSCVLQATARKHGLHATASRTVSRSPLDEVRRAEFDTALRMRTSHLVNARLGERVTTALETGRNLLRPTPYEHEWWAAPPVVLTGREPSEGLFTTNAADRWTASWAAVWQERIGAGAARPGIQLRGRVGEAMKCGTDAAASQSPIE